MIKMQYITNVRLPTEKIHGYQIMKMCSEYAKIGIEIELLVPKRLNHIKKDPFDYYKIDKNFNIRHINNIDTIILCKSTVPSLLKKIFFNFQSLTFTIASLTKIKKGRILLTRSLMVAFFLSFSKNKYLYECHTTNFGVNILYQRIFKKSFKIITTSKGHNEELKKHKDKIIYAPNGVDIKNFDNLKIKTKKKTITHTGSLQKYKGVDVFMDSYTYLKSKNILYNIVGGDKTTNILLKKKYPKINFINRVSNSEVYKILKSSHILVLPNSNKYKDSKYTSPIKLFEYLASERPIISSDINNIKDIVTTNEVLFFKSDNPEDLAKKIDLLLNDTSLQKKLSKKARLIAQKYTWENRAKSISKEINNA